MEQKQATRKSMKHSSESSFSSQRDTSAAYNYSKRELALNEIDFTNYALLRHRLVSWLDEQRATS